MDTPSYSKCKTIYMDLKMSKALFHDPYLQNNIQGWGRLKPAAHRNRFFNIYVNSEGDMVMAEKHIKQVVMENSGLTYLCQECVAVYIDNSKLGCLIPHTPFQSNFFPITAFLHFVK